MPEKKQILRAIAVLGKELRRAPTRSEFTSRSGISAYFVLQSFRSWSEAVTAAGLHPYAQNTKIEDRVLLEEWGRYVRRKRTIPPRHIYLLEGKHNPGTLAIRFGGWLSVPRVFRNFAKGKREWTDVLALLPAPMERKQRGRPKKDVASAIPSSKALHALLKDRATYGNPLDFPWLRHEPVNEQGVVLLFGMIAKELGYIVEAVQGGFPDCEAKRRIGADRWQRVRIEFEFESRNFRDHGHPSTGCDVIVCWRHNWDERPGQIEIVELRSVIESLAKSGD